MPSSVLKQLGREKQPGNSEVHEVRETEAARNAQQELRWTKFSA